MLAFRRFVIGAWNLELPSSFVLRPSSLIACRLIIDPSLDGAWNMALDEALLMAAETDGVAALRFYSWREPTLSLGYFQSHADRGGHAASNSCTMIRRASGGGAILHDRELTYSIALPRSHELAARAEKLYFAAHETLIEMLAQLRITVTLCEPAANRRLRPDEEPFLCFQRRVRGDVLVGTHKVAGSAQRRQRGAVLQHGSILLARSPFAPELPGISELAAVQLDAVQLRNLWQPRLAERLGVTLEESEPSDSALATAREITRSKFASSEWTARR
jgi:lipoyl(octanoyl) transferase